jgi:UDP-N-acetylglucosamine--N-acetylmuramyl-(pentapeptide) pyrophosphoryl-undecaprenol N-acetylglucosamine transferase
MTIVLTGGGSGGHITPLLAVAAEIKHRHPETKIVYIAQRGDALGDVVARHHAIDETRRIWAGKLRRYHGEGFRQLLDVKTAFFNIRDVFLVALGCIESLWHLTRLKPDAVFIKGGFVGVPVGLGSAILRVPYVTHDSDAVAGLANRIISRWASAHAVALPTETYAYPPDKTVNTGVPISNVYRFVTAEDQKVYKNKAKLPEDSYVILVTGGGLGAQIINNSMVEVVLDLLKEFPNLHIVHTTGHKQYNHVKKAYENVLLNKNLRTQVHVLDYTTELHTFSGAADVVVTRAGATNMAELAMQGKACIVIPNPVLAGGHQLKNAVAYESAQAIMIVTERSLRKSSAELQRAITKMLSNPEVRIRTGKNIHAFAHPDATKELVNLLLAHVKPEKGI